MEEKELLEIEAREREQTRKNLAEMVRKNKIGDVLLLYKDKFTLENKKACYPIGWVQVPLVIPLYEKVLVGIPPFHSSEEFRRTQGFSIDEIVEWRNKGWVETLLTLPHSEYAGLDYLDQLIRVSPSMGVRTTGHSWLLAGGRDSFARLIREGESLLKGVKPHEEYRRLFGEPSERIYQKGAVGIYVAVCAFGMTELANEIRILSRGDPDRAASMLYFTEAFLLQPLTSGLRQTTIYRSELKEAVSEFQRVLTTPHQELFLPCWTADVYQNLGATMPQSMDTDEIDAVRKHSEDFVQAVKSMDEEIDKAVRQRFGGGELNRSEKETITSEKEEFRKRWLEDVVPAFEDISTVKKTWSIGLTGSIVTSVVALAALKDVLTVPSTMLGALLNREKIMKLVDPAAEFLSTFFECNPIHLGFYKVHRELKKIKQRRGDR
jgi:hypothetical protein